MCNAPACKPRPMPNRQRPRKGSLLAPPGTASAPIISPRLVCRFCAGAPLIRPKPRNRAARWSQSLTKSWRRSSGRKATRSASESNSRAIMPPPPRAAAPASAPMRISAAKPEKKPSKSSASFPTTETAAVRETTRRRRCTFRLRAGSKATFRSSSASVRSLPAAKPAPPICCAAPSAKSIPRFPILSLKSFAQHLDSNFQLWMVRAGAAMFSVFGGLALGLAVVGLYGVKAYSVARRTREIGIRMALGAQPGAVLRMIMREGSIMLVRGLLLGLLLAAATGKILSGMLYEVGALDPVAFTVAPLSSPSPHWSPPGSPPAAPPASARWQRCEWSRSTVRRGGWGGN